MFSNTEFSVCKWFDLRWSECREGEKTDREKEKEKCKLMNFVECLECMSNWRIKFIRKYHTQCALNYMLKSICIYNVVTLFIFIKHIYNKYSIKKMCPQPFNCITNNETQKFFSFILLPKSVCWCAKMKKKKTIKTHSQNSLLHSSSRWKFRVLFNWFKFI